jgi:hypothetical protein
MKSDLVRGDNLVVFFYPSASYFWPDNLMMDYCIHVSGTYQSEKKMENLQNDIENVNSVQMDMSDAGTQRVNSI